MKYFVVSDIHSFYNSFINALKEKGFDKNNKDHTLVILGDIFDRGEDSLKLFKYLKSLNQKRLVLVKGNHEALFLELLKKEYPERHDFHNGTVLTFYQLAEKLPGSLDAELLEGIDHISLTYRLQDRYIAESYEYWQRVVDVVKEDKFGIVKWLKSKKWKDYFEIGKYIMVHSFIPMKNNDGYAVPSYNRDWRTNSTKEEWYYSRWSNPFDLYDNGYFDEEKRKGKILVFGHWHCSDGNQRYNGASDSYENFDICKHENLIGIDACTAYSNKVNVLVIDDLE